MRIFLLAMGLAAGPACAQLTAHSSAVFDSEAHTVRFTIAFSGMPDFMTTDPEGRVCDSFQLYLYTLPHPGLNGQGNTIVRGDEIHTFGQIPFRNDMLPGGGEPGSGGWGPIAGMAPFSLGERVLHFTAPFSVVNTETGEFSYNLMLTHFGERTYWSPRNHSIPGPGAAPLLLGLLAFRRRRTVGF